MKFQLNVCPSSIVLRNKEKKNNKALELNGGSSADAS
jgi:hypothetical protein